MKRFAKSLLAIFSVFVLTAFFASVLYSQESTERAKQILEMTYQKYKNLLKEDGEGLKSIAATVSIKGGGQMPMGDSGSMPMDIDAVVELYAVRPRHLYVDISANLGNAKIIVAGKEKVTATILLPSTKQFTAIDVPQKYIEKTQGDEPEKPDRMEELLKEAILAYEGTHETKAGKAHKIVINPRDPKEKGSVAVYILDDRWDPVRFEASDPEGGGVVVNFEKLELNVDIPDERFVPATEGYTQISKEQLTTVLMMQLMAVMMQQEKQE